MQLKKALRPYYDVKGNGQFIDAYDAVSSGKLILDTFLEEYTLYTPEGDVCNIQQGVGHCCGASFLTKFRKNFYTDFDAVKQFLSEYRDNFRWQLQNKVFFYLSDETAAWDKEIRARDDVREVFSFKNYATKPYSGSNVSLFVLDLT